MTEQQQQKINDDVAAPHVKTFTEFMPEPYLDAGMGGVSYKGWAPLGVASSDPGWMIIRFTASGGVTIAEYADGNMQFDNVWDDRGTLNYSR